MNYLGDFICVITLFLFGMFCVVSEMVYPCVPLPAPVTIGAGLVCILLSYLGGRKL